MRDTRFGTYVETYGGLAIKSALAYCLSRSHKSSKGKTVSDRLGTAALQRARKYLENQGRFRSWSQKQVTGKVILLGQIAPKVVDQRRAQYFAFPFVYLPWTSKPPCLREQVPPCLSTPCGLRKSSPASAGGEGG